ncbi:MAG: hypothetical protein AAGE01_05955 [Pseudomonadota bacterium]
MARGRTWVIACAGWLIAVAAGTATVAGAIAIGPGVAIVLGGAALGLDPGFFGSPLGKLDDPSLDRSNRRAQLLTWLGFLIMIVSLTSDGPLSRPLGG